MSRAGDPRSFSCESLEFYSLFTRLVISDTNSTNLLDAAGYDTCLPQFY